MCAISLLVLGVYMSDTTIADWFPTERGDQIHLAMVVLHGAGALGTMVMVWWCDVAEANQVAMLPAAIPIPGNASGNISEVRAYRAAFPWSEDAVFETHRWNPYLLIMAFEWLTAGFALCNLWRWLKNVKDWAVGWLSLGLVPIFMWFVLNPRRDTEFCAAMGIILALSYIAAASICSAYTSEKNRTKWAESEGNDEKGADEKGESEWKDGYDAKEEGKLPPSIPGHERPLTVGKRVVVDGRTWVIPRRATTARKNNNNKGQRGVGSADEDPSQPLMWGKGNVHRFRDAVYDVGFRYMEYCVTAPLLFIALMCMLVVDAPAWLFLVGYWMIQACNLIGISYHYTICADIDGKKQDGNNNKGGDRVEGSQWMQNLVEWFKSLLIKGSWEDRYVNQAYLLQNSWLCLVLPLGGLGYVIRYWIFSSELPWIAATMIWLLLVSYSMFGVVPSVVYLSGQREWIQALPWCLDVLNLVAKFPIPILILIAFSTSPTGFHACSA